MAQIKSAMKRIKTNEKARLRNKAVKTGLKTTLKNFNEAVEAGDKEKATVAYNTAVKKLDQAVTKGIMHKNSAARKKSTIARAFNSMTD